MVLMTSLRAVEGWGFSWDFSRIRRIFVKWDFVGRAGLWREESGGDGAEDFGGLGHV